MAIQLAVSTRNARLDAIETDTGVSAIMKIRTGAQPASCATADSGTVLATLNLPSDWLAAASAGVKGKAGTWSDLSADAGGTIGHFRVYKSDGTTCIIQGTAGTSGDLTTDSATTTAGQQFTVTQFDLTDGNA